MSSAERDKRWHYEKAEKKREVFYQELVAESKQWKDWRAGQIAAKASEAEEETGAEEDDEGEDLEVVSQHHSSPVEEPGKKGSLRRHSDADEHDSDHKLSSAAHCSSPVVDSHQQQHSTPREKGTTFVVEIPSPSRQRHRTESRQSPVKEYTMALDNSPEPEDAYMTSTPKASVSTILAEGVTSQESEKDIELGLLAAIKEKVQDAPKEGLMASPLYTEAGGLKHDGPVMFRQSHDQQEGSAALMGNARQNMADDTSGSEDSSAEITDNENRETQDTAKPSLKSSIPDSSVPKSSTIKLSVLDTSANDESFPAVMIKPVHSSQGQKKEEAIDMTEDGDDDDLSAAHASSVQGKTPARYSPPESIDRNVEAAVKETLSTKSTSRKRQLSSGSQSQPPLSSKPESGSSSKRARQHGKGGPKPTFSARRTIPQDPSDSESDIISNKKDTNAIISDGATPNEIKPNSSQARGSAGNAPSSSRDDDGTILISESEDDMNTLLDDKASSAEGRNTKPEFPSQPIQSSASSDTPIREKLGRPPSRKQA